MKLAFTLSMPGRNSWNGRWSGEDTVYAIVRPFTTIKAKAKAETMKAHRYYSYSFGDGWRAGVEVKEVSNDEARVIRRKSKGFCGYDWMVQSILDHGAIYGSKDEIPQAKEVKIPALTAPLVLAGVCNVNQF